VLGAAGRGPTFYRPAGVGVDGRGNVYLSDAGDFRIVKLSRSGKALAAWGRSGSGPGAFGSTKTCSACEPLGPGALAVTRRGVVYVDDPANGRIEAFSSGGRLLAAWKTGLAEPLSLAVDGRGHLVAAEHGTQVVTFSATGKILARRQVEEGGRDGITVESVAVDAHANVYAAAWWPDSSHPLYQQHWFVEKLSPTGERLASWQDVGGALAVGADGRVYVGSGGRLDVLDPTGRLVAHWGRGRFTSIAGISLDGRGRLYVADDESNRVLELSAGGAALRRWGAGGTGPGRFVAPWDIAVSGNGDLYVDDVRSQPTTIQRLSATGRPRAHWAAPVEHGMGVDRRGNVYVLAYPGHATLREYTPNGRLAAEWPLDRPASRLTADGRGDVYLLSDCSSPCVEKLRAGHVVGSWTLPLDAKVVTDGPMTVDANGNVFATELLPDLTYGLVKIAPGLQPEEASITRVGARSWSRVTGLAADGLGSVYVVEAQHDRVQKVSATGRLVATFGRPGSRPGMFHEPGGVALDAAGSIYVTDSGNSRVQKRGAR
jgi:DNA-binding beta-propeller fold protein YncE